MNQTLNSAAETQNLRFNSFTAPPLPPHERLLSALAALIPYRWPILCGFLFLSGLLIGRLLKDSKLELCLQNYQQYTNQEQQILKTQKSFDQKFGVVRKFLFVLLFMASLYTAVVAVQTDRSKLGSTFLSANLPLFLGVLGLVAALWMSNRFKQWRLRRIQNSLQEFIDQKEVFLEEFLQLIGADMKVGIVRHESKRLAEKLETENKRLSEMVTEKSILESSLQKVKRSLTIDSQMHAALEDFTSKLFSYDWCENCYDEEAIREYVDRLVAARLSPKETGKTKKDSPQESKQISPKNNPKESGKEEVPAKEDGASRPKDEREAAPESPEQALPPLPIPGRPQDCTKDCLLRYHVFCDKLNQELTEKVQKVKANSRPA